MSLGEMGKIYDDGELIVRQGQKGEEMYVLQGGKAEVIVKGSQGEIQLSILEPGDVFGEMALFTRAPRSASVRALGGARALTIDKKGFLRRVHEDPSLAFRILEKLSERVQRLDNEIIHLKDQLSEAGKRK